MYTLAHTGFSYIIYGVLALIALVSGLLAKFKNRRHRDDS
jgi:LPXTG-motif cell wall-anchored protein